MEAKTPSILYRYRPIDALLDKHHELERQELCLSGPTALNDPMEGYKDVTWLGDSVLWANLLRHYTLSLMDAFIEHLLASDAPVQDIQIRIAISPADSRTETFRKAATLAIATFFASPCVTEVLRQLSELSVPIRREGLHSYLVVLHGIAWQAVRNALAANGVCTPSNPEAQVNETELLASIRETGFANARLAENPVHLDMAFGATSRIHQQLGLIFNYNNRDSGHPKKTYLLSRFPELYVDGLVANLVHPPWYVASFSRTCTNASMWGTYAACHTGVALKFSLSDSDDRPYLPLANTELSGAASIEPVDYSTRSPTLEFFRSLGNLADSGVVKTWLTDEAGNLSAKACDMFSGGDEWRKRYWTDFHSCVTTKLADWKHEEEVRMILRGTPETPTSRHLVQYDFNSLVGIVFGLATSIHNKLRIFEIVDRMCHLTGRTHFEFHQARYSVSSGQITLAPLGLLRFNFGDSDART